MAADTIVGANVTEEQKYGVLVTPRTLTPPIVSKYKDDMELATGTVHLMTIRQMLQLSTRGEVTVTFGDREVNIHTYKEIFGL